MAPTFAGLAEHVEAVPLSALARGEELIGQVTR